MGHPRAGTNLHLGQGIPKLGWGYRKLHSATGRILSRSLLKPTTHGLSFPTCLFHPRNMHLHCSTVHRLLHFSFRVSATGWIRNSQSSIAGAGLSLGENHFPENSLTWRELLIDLTTFLFNHGPDNPLFQHTPRLSSSQVRKIVTVQHSFTQEWQKETSHTQYRNRVSTTTHSYDTTRLRKIRNTQTSHDPHGITWFSHGF